jgi:hypothetical protein
MGEGCDMTVNCRSLLYGWLVNDNNSIDNTVHKIESQ